MRTPKGEQAHHLIPLELRSHSIVQRAARGGFNFNGRMNGMNLGPARHNGSHPEYTSLVERYLNRSVAKGMTDRQAAVFLRNYATRIRTLISKGQIKLR